MTSLIDRYFNTLASGWKGAKLIHRGSIEQAAELCARSIAPRTSSTFGTTAPARVGNFPRVRHIIVGFRPIAESDDLVPPRLG